MDDVEAKRKVLELLITNLSDQGLLIEGGWAALAATALPADAPAIQLREMRKAFFMGAQHLFASLMGIMEPGEEPTEKDMDRMGLIAKELEAFHDALTKDMDDLDRSRYSRRPKI